MNLFLSHASALTYWREHFPLDSEIGKPAHVSTAENYVYQKSDILALVPESWIDPGHPVDVLVFDANQRRQSKRIRSHLWSSSIPTGAFYRDRGIYVSSPEFTFLQMAPQLSIHQLIALGCELCGTYVLLPKNRQHPGAIDDHPKRIAPLTNIDRLNAFLAQAEGAQGIRKARRAMRFIAEGSRSPMETMTFMLLCLSPLLGGYGLPKASLNPEIPLDDEARVVAQQRKAQGDICWPDQSLDIEYNGEVHAGLQKMREDAGRVLGIESMGWHVITITSPQVFDIDRFEIVAKEAADHLNWYFQKRTLGNTSARRTLHEELESWMFKYDTR